MKEGDIVEIYEKRYVAGKYWNGGRDFWPTTSDGTRPDMRKGVQRFGMASLEFVKVVGHYDWPKR